MAKVLTFSRTFPGYHPRKNQPTFFVEKIFAGLADILPEFKIPRDFTLYDFYEYCNAIPKFHTIRSGHRFKVGDKFSPRVWSGKPYRSPQIIIAPDIEVVKVWDFEINGMWRLNNEPQSHNQLEVIACHDGLNISDFLNWFKNGFSGQIICWNKDIKY